MIYCYPDSSINFTAVHMNKASFVYLGCTPFNSTMKLIIALCSVLFSIHSFAQNYVLPEGEFMDTVINNDTTCKDYNIYYYSVGGKQRKSSSTLLNEVLSFLKQKNNLYAGSGYITYQFKIDCLGNKMRRTQVLQTDEIYKSYHFKKELVEELYLFLNSLTTWKMAQNKDGQVFPYNAFMTFKIKNGKVINIIP